MVAYLGGVNSFQKHSKGLPAKSSFKNLEITFSVVFLWFFLFGLYFTEVEMTKKCFLIRF